jgi:hypothetical protein
LDLVWELDDLVGVGVEAPQLAQQSDLLGQGFEIVLEEIQVHKIPQAADLDGELLEPVVANVEELKQRGVPDLRLPNQAITTLS